jgi:hypothetical protein
MAPSLRRARGQDDRRDLVDDSLDLGFRRADVAQLVEHSLGKGEVISSILIIGSMRFCLRRFDRARFKRVDESPI